MKKIFLILLGLSIVTACTNHSEHSSETKEVQQKVVSYICPMHPQITSDRPGSCPICKMDLVLVEDDDEVQQHEGHEHTSEKEAMKVQPSNEKPYGRGDVKLSLEKEQLIGITSVEVKKRELFQIVRAPGRIAFDPELYSAQSEYLEAIRQWSKVKNSPLKEVKRSTKEMIKSSEVRLKVLGLNSEQIEELSKQGSVSEALIIGSGKGENLIYADVFETDLSGIKQGQSVVIVGSFLGGQEIKGETIAVDQVIDPKTRTGKVRIKILETKASIRPEAFVNVSIRVPLGEHLAVPIDSVLDTGRDLFVFIKREGGKYEPRKITKLFETDDYVAILSGVKSGEVVVTAANFMLDSESRLKAVIKESSSNSEHNH